MATFRITIPRPPKPVQVRRMLGLGLKAAAPAAVGIVQRRTAQGNDLHGRAFRPYSKGYAERKAETGRNVGTVNLTVTGELLRRLRVLRAEGLRVIIGFEGQHRDWRFSRVDEAWQKIEHAGATRDSRGRQRINNRYVREYERIAGKGKRLKGGRRAGYTIERLPTTTPMASVVLGNNRLRPFFGIVMRHEINVLVQAAQRAIDAELARLTAQAQQRR